MKEPNHNVKLHIVPFLGNKKPYWLDHPVHGWLSTGVKDKNGVEIYEGDLLYVCFKKDSRYGGKETVLSPFFSNGAFWLYEFALLLTDEDIESLEVFGHKATVVPIGGKADEDTEETAEALWQLDADGNAFSPEERILRVPLAGEMTGDYIIIRKPKDRVVSEKGFLAFAYDEDEALIIIKNFVDKLNTKDINPSSRRTNNENERD